MGIWDGFDAFIGGLDGKIIAGDLYFVYDEDHKRKVKELVNRDSRYLYEIQKKCGIDPYNEDDYYGPDNDIRIVNIDHFAIRASLKNKADELKKIVYDAIDEVYANADSYEFSDDDDSDFDTWDFDDDEN